MGLTPRQMIPPDRAAPDAADAPAQPTTRARLPRLAGTTPILTLDWSKHLRVIERRRRQLARVTGTGVPALPTDYLARFTTASFRLDGIEITAADVAAALRPRRRDGHAFRSRAGNRVRSHAAVLLSIERRLAARAVAHRELTVDDIVRWYTRISGGLSTGGLPPPAVDRLGDAARRVSIPQYRLQPALVDAARLHVRLLVDPVVPGFHGVLARLLLRHHLGRCGLPGIIPDFDPDPAPTLDRLLPQLLYRIERAFGEGTA